MTGAETRPTRLDELACMLRSKNAGTFTMTFDIIATDEEAYTRIEASGQLSRRSRPPVLGGPGRRRGPLGAGAARRQGQHPPSVFHGGA